MHLKTQSVTKIFHDAESISHLFCCERIFIFFFRKQGEAANFTGIDLHSAYSARNFFMK